MQRRIGKFNGKKALECSRVGQVRGELVALQLGRK